MQLRTRHWRITDATRRTEEVRGPGVVGQTPVLEPGASFRYTSGCPLATPSGIMVGSYQMTTEAGERIDVAVPAFSLDSPHTNAQPELKDEMAPRARHGEGTAGAARRLRHDQP